MVTNNAPKQSQVGKVFGRLTVLSFSHRDRHKHPHWLCQCECGNQKSVSGHSLRRGATTSCGCAHFEAITKFKFGSARASGLKKLYDTWHHMIDRCHNEKNKSYRRYGGRGISVCERWRLGEDGALAFECFVADIERLEKNGSSLDRIDNDGDYCAENVRWATKKQQSLNRGDNRIISYLGQSRPLSEWCESLGLPYNRTSLRLRNGWPLEEAFLKDSFRHAPRRRAKG